MINASTQVVSITFINNQGTKFSLPLNKTKQTHVDFHSYILQRISFLYLKHMQRAKFNIFKKLIDKYLKKLILLFTLFC